jgi:hypothetical protein
MLFEWSRLDLQELVVERTELTWRRDREALEERPTLRCRILELLTLLSVE